MRKRGTQKKQMRPAGSVLDESMQTMSSVTTDRTTAQWTRKMTANLKVHYRAVANAISDKRNYKMTNWQE